MDYYQASTTFYSLYSKGAAPSVAWLGVSSNALQWITITRSKHPETCEEACADFCVGPVTSFLEQLGMTPSSSTGRQPTWKTLPHDGR